VAETLAAVLGIPFLALDMGTYGERNSVSSLIGAPPGYVGYDDGGKLTEFARRHPVCVILIDKINKASEPVRDIVSKAIAEGQIFDSRGRRVNFRNAIFVVSQDTETASRSIGFRTGAGHDTVQGISGLTFDRMFAFELLSGEAATEMVGRRFDLVSESYSSAGNRMTVLPAAVEVVTARGRESGGRAGDYMSAFAEMFEAELFRKTLPQGGALRVSGSGGRIAVDLEDSDAIAA
jgi:hypothetical protein